MPWNVDLSTNTVKITGSFNAADASLEKMRSNIFSSLASELYIQRMDEVVKDVVAHEENNSDKTFKTVTIHHFYVKPSIHNIDAVLISFKSTLTKCLQGAATLCKPKVLVELDQPFHLYNNYFDFNLNKLNIKDIKLQITAEYKAPQAALGAYQEGSWDIQSEGGFNTLLIIGWLNSVKSLVGMTEQPTAHNSLLFIKNRLVKVLKRLSS